jgi:orotidine-5'-phosphate decarboxylase
MSFAARLHDAILAKRTPAMVGIDPSWPELPEELRREAIAQLGESLGAVAHAYRDFGLGILDAVADLTPAIKFQSAFFESAGPQGVSVLHELMRHARSLGLIVILDGKRNDIGNTAAAYASAYLGGTVLGNETAFPSDALTVNPYLGEEGLEPFVNQTRHSSTGIFVLVRTSNPGAQVLQDAQVDNRSVHEIVADWVYQSSLQTRGSEPYSPVGAVVGATVPRQLAQLRARLPHSILLVPGFGAQGGTAHDCAAAFDSNGLGAVVNNSRGIIYAYKKYSLLSWKDAARKALGAMNDELRSAIPR